MFLQQKMTPTSAANPEMAKVMMLMPVVFTFLFINFASGLVLYFFVNNMLQMAQQHFINKDR
jgi:YidC/Oxa1 family membrane protein insertase